MSEIPGYTLEKYIEWNHYYINDDLLAKYEPFREVIEDWLDDFDEENQSWRGYAGNCPIDIE